jgi:hypothetical protein
MRARRKERACTRPEPCNRRRHQSGHARHKRLSLIDIQTLCALVSRMMRTGMPVVAPLPTGCPCLEAQPGFW